MKLEFSSLTMMSARHQAPFTHAALIWHWHGPYPREAYLAICWLLYAKVAVLSVRRQSYCWLGCPTILHFIVEMQICIRINIPYSIKLKSCGWIVHKPGSYCENKWKTKLTKILFFPNIDYLHTHDKQWECLGLFSNFTHIIWWTRHWLRNHSLGGESPPLHLTV